MDRITVKLIGNKSGIYIDACNCNAYMNIREAENFTAIDFTGVNNVVVYRFEDGRFFIAQAGGYTEERGIFVDLYEAA